MANFKELNENLETVQQILLSNDNLCKLLHYNEPNALSQEPLLNPNEMLLYTKIFPYPTDVRILTEVSCLLIIGLDDFKEMEGNNFVSNTLYFRILCHPELWKLDSGLRPYHIAHEISTMFNNERVLGIGKLMFEGGGEIKYGEYAGLELGYRIVDFS